VTSKAQQFLRERDRNQPFFLFVGYVDTHAPFTEHPERLVRRYRNAQFVDIPQETYRGPGRAVFTPPREEAARREALAQYYAAVTYIDEQIGILLDELESMEDLDDTLVVYTSDHGHMNGQHGLSTKGNATVPQNFYEESIRVPCLLRWPGHIQAQRTHDLFVDHCDLFQTLLDAAGCQESEVEAKRRHSSGRSYLPPLTGTPLETPWRTEQFCEYGNARMIRTDRYKRIVRYPPHSEHFPDELYDLQADSHENVNAIANRGNAEIAQDLRARLDSYFARYEEPERSGRDILARSRYNPNEPWRATALTP
jgi:arylsulfatase A-like enzyme